MGELKALIEAYQNLSVEDWPLCIELCLKQDTKEEEEENTSQPIHIVPLGPKDNNPNFCTLLIPPQTTTKDPETKNDSTYHNNTIEGDPPPPLRSQHVQTMNNTENIYEDDVDTKINESKKDVTPKRKRDSNDSSQKTKGK